MLNNKGKKKLTKKIIGLSKVKVFSLPKITGRVSKPFRLSSFSSFKSRIICIKIAFKKTNNPKNPAKIVKWLKGKNTSEAKNRATKIFLKRGIFLVKFLKNNG